jgi:putative FmdB family regulatory protein
VPTYQYSCTECGHFFEQFQSFSENSLTTCPECQGRLRKVFNAVGVVFKGSGFYRTDSRSGGDGKAGSDSSGSKDSSTSTGSGSAGAADKGSGTSGGTSSGTSSSGSSKPGSKPGSKTGSKAGSAA